MKTCTSASVQAATKPSSALMATPQAPGRGSSAVGWTGLQRANRDKQLRVLFTVKSAASLRAACLQHCNARHDCCRVASSKCANTHMHIGAHLSRSRIWSIMEELWTASNPAGSGLSASASVGLRIVMGARQG